MKTATLAVLVAVLAACASGPEKRIKQHESVFNGYPTDVQQKIRQGVVGVGFTAEQAAMAAGKPDRVYTRKTATGDQEIWAYGRSGGGTSVGFGLGVGSFGAPVVYDAGVGIGSDGGDDRMRVVFEGGRVVSVEQRER